MRYLELRGHPPDSAPKLFRLIADSPPVERAHLLEWNRSTSGGLTALYRIDGDIDAFLAELEETEIVETFDITRSGPEQCYVLLVVRPPDVPVFEQLIDAVARMGLLLATPVRYQDGAAHFRLIGDAETLQAMVHAVPDAFDLEVRRVGSYPDPETAPERRLSDRQREAMMVARELGYYETPREATHADVAAELGCAPNTASEHLQKAEAKLVHATLPGSMS